ncbi:MAG: ion channel [Candidatus Omnitrophica bacterium]|nr:ion channel [Candidatus Omnitrophota bacterium]
MINFLKIFANFETLSYEEKESAYRQQIRHLKEVWSDNTYGLERLFRLFLCLAQFIFPLLLIRDIFGRCGAISRKIAVEFYNLFKLFFPLIILYFGFYRYPLIVAFVIYLLSETILHILNLIFLEDIHVADISYRRSMLLLLLHYLEVVLDFAVIYIGFDLLSERLSGISAVYFSLVTSTTVGFGDIHAKNTVAQLVVIIQLLVCVLFIILFVNYFSGKF